MSAKKLISRLFIAASICATAHCNAAESILPLKTWTTSKGTPVYYVQETELPMVDVQVVFDAGSARDYSKPGIAKMTAESLSSGTASKNAYQVASAFEDVGALYTSAVSKDMTIVAMRSLTDPKFMEPALSMFTEVVAHPSFPIDEYSRIRKQILNGLEEQEEQPATIAAKAFYNAVYNENPYGHPVAGTKASVTTFTPQDSIQFHKDNFTAQNSLIAIVGNIDEAKAKQIAENLSSQLYSGKPQPPLVFKSLPSTSQFQHIAFPSSQTHVLIGQAAINRNDPNYFPIMVGNYILGGGSLTSRLFDEVREKRGLAYTVHSQFNAMKERGPFVIELQTRNSEASNAIQVVTNTLNRFLNEGPTSQELDAAKKNLTQGFILRLASNSAIMGQVVNIGYYKLPLDYLDTYRNNIAKVSDKHVKEVFQSVIHPNNLVTITVGDNVARENTKEAVK